MKMWLLKKTWKLFMITLFKRKLYIKYDYVKYVCYGNNECVWVIGLWIEFSEKFKILFYNGNFFKIKFSKVNPFISHMSYLLSLCIMIFLPQPAECWGGGLQHHGYLHLLTRKFLPRTDYPQSGAHRLC